MGYQAVIRICQQITEWIDKFGKKKKTYEIVDVNETIRDKLSELYRKKILDIFEIADKKKRNDMFDMLWQSIQEDFVTPDMSEREVKCAFKVFF